jgi:hypothetical protein
MPEILLRGLSEDERLLLNRLTMFGSDAYPISKLSGGWCWGPVGTIKGPPVIFPTKRLAVASFEAFYQILLDAKAGRI